jgi:hypothetical protein
LRHPYPYPIALLSLFAGFAFFARDNVFISSRMEKGGEGHVETAPEVREKIAHREQGI